MIREAVETLGPPGVLPSGEAVISLYGPEPIHEAEAIVDALAVILGDDPALVLVVEDDPDVRRIAADIFHEAELKTAEASTAEQALAFLREHAPDVRLVLTDMVLPGRLDGIDLARVASLRWPWIRVVVTTGWARVKDIPQNVVFLPKPWRRLGHRSEWHVRNRIEAPTDECRSFCPSHIHNGCR